MSDIFNRSLVSQSEILFAGGERTVSYLQMQSQFQLEFGHCGLFMMFQVLLTKLFGYIPEVIHWTNRT